MTAQKKIFGTDGVRGRANIEPVTAETALKLGRAAGHVFKRLETQARSRDRHQIVIGKDTRLSGYMLENAISSGVLSMGVNVLLIGPLPTPGVAYVARSLRADAGIVITASHNPYDDNGIKVLWSGRIQAGRPHRAKDRGACLQRRDREYPTDRRRNRQGGSHRGRARALHRVREILLSARHDA